MGDYIRLKTNIIEFDIPLNEKYTLVSGDSGSGKSFTLSCINEAIITGDVALQCTLPIVVLRDRASLSAIKDNNVLYVCDEFLAHSVIVATEGLRCHCLLITRKIYTDINLSVNCLYTLNRNVSGVSTISERYDIYKGALSGKPDLIITEDSGKGFDFLCKIFSEEKVKSAKGKSNLSKLLREVPTDINIVMIADLGGLAPYYDYIVKRIERIKQSGGSVLLLLPVCFEHILLCSEFLGFDKDVYKYFDTKFNGTEKFCEWLLELNTRNKPFEIKHSKTGLAECWYKDCNCPDCKYAILGNKLESVLKNGPVPELLDLIDGGDEVGKR